jgi:hypothetical protein
MVNNSHASHQSPQSRVIVHDGPQPLSTSSRNSVIMALVAVLLSVGQVLVVHQGYSNRDSVEVIIGKLDRDACRKKISMVFIRGERCLAHRCQVKFVWRSQQGEGFEYVPFDQIVEVRKFFSYS